MSDLIIILLLATIILLSVGLILVTLTVIHRFDKSDSGMKTLINDINSRMLALTSEVVLDYTTRLTEESAKSLEETIREKDIEVTRAIMDKQREPFNPFVQDPGVEDSPELASRSSNLYIDKVEE